MRAAARLSLLFLRQPGQTEGNIFRDGPMRKQRVVLEKHSDVALARRNRDLAIRIKKHASVQGYAAFIRMFEPCDAAKQHGFARPGWSQNAQRPIVRSERYVKGEIRKLLLDLDFERHLQFRAHREADVRDACERVQ